MADGGGVKVNGEPLTGVPLKIVQVVTLVSPDGAYGGPVRVAQNQAQELAARGHKVQVFAGMRGRVDPAYFGPGVATRLFRAVRVLPKTGFAGMAAPSMLRQLWRALKEADVVHLHLARDLVMLPAAVLCLLRGVPVVVQSHGMIDESDSKLAALLDKAITIRVLRAAHRCFWLTPEERNSLQNLMGGDDGALEQLVNGVPASRYRAEAPGDSVEFLYLARLQKRKRPTVLVEAAARLAAVSQRLFGVAFVGPDEGEEAEVRRRIQDSGAAHRMRVEGPLHPHRTVDRMRRASVLVLPSVHEPFPMSVLEAMSVGLPVVVTDSCGLAPFIESAGAGLVCDSSVESLSASLLRFLEEPGLWESTAAAALNLAQQTFSMGRVAEQLERVYGSVSGRQTPSPATDIAPGHH